MSPRGPVEDGSLPLVPPIFEGELGEVTFPLSGSAERPLSGADLRILTDQGWLDLEDGSGALLLRIRLSDAELRNVDVTPLGITRELHRPGGTVIDQSPIPDTVVSAGSPVTLTVSARSAAAGQSDKEFHIRYEVSQSGSQRHIRIVAVGKKGDREIFNGLREPGSEIDLMLPYGGTDRVRIFVNGILVEEREVK